METPDEKFRKNFAKSTTSRVLNFRWEYPRKKLTTGAAPRQHCRRTFNTGVVLVELRKVPLA